jgi:hypothetical protein
MMRLDNFQRERAALSPAIHQISSSIRSARIAGHGIGRHLGRSHLRAPSESRPAKAGGKTPAAHHIMAWIGQRIVHAQTRQLHHAVIVVERAAYASRWNAGRRPTTAIPIRVVATIISRSVNPRLRLTL